MISMLQTLMNNLQIKVIFNIFLVPVNSLMTSDLLLLNKFQK